MYLLQTSNGFSWKKLLLGSEDWSFLAETVLRTSIMFVIILIALKILGKRGVKQLSVFELVVIIGLGSAAGDPMFYKDVGILPAFIVFFMIIALYSLITYLVGKSKKFEKIIEGKPVYLIQNGVFCIENFKKETLGEDEFFAELRMAGISQLGQIEQAIVEVSGNLSLFYFNDDKVKYGLPIMPGIFDTQAEKIVETNIYSCSFCGFTEEIQPVSKHHCPSCKKTYWIISSNKKRVN